MVVFENGKNIKKIGGFAAKLDYDVEVVMLTMIEGG
jgi:hypothetical protein